MNSRQAERGIALMRIVVGAWLSYAAAGNLVWAPFPWASATWTQATAGRLAQHSLSHPQGWARGIVQSHLLPNAEWVAGGSALLQLIAGLSLLFGLVTLLGALLLLLLSVFNGGLNYYMGSVYLGFYVFSGLAAVIFFATRAGRRWGFDTLLAGINNRSSFW